MNSNFKYKLIIFLIIGLAIYLCGEFFRTQHFINIGIDMADNARPYTQNPLNPTKQVLFIGDSSALGTGADSPERSVAGYLGQDFPDYQIDNLAVNGMKIEGLIAELKKLDEKKFDIVFIHIGGNDIVRFTPTKEFRQNLVMVLNEAKSISEKVIILHGGNVGTSKLFPWFTRWIFTERTKYFRNIYLELADSKQVFYIDMFMQVKQDPFYLEPEKYYAADNFHPSADGYQLWYRDIKKQTDLR
jgi:lysophospholipase L1-like esterase